METEFKLTLEIIITLIGLLFTAYFAIYYNKKINLQQSLYRKDKIKVLEAHTFEQKYKTKLQALIEWIENIYSSATLIQNYSRHVTIALLYSFVFFLVFWILGSDGKIGTIEILKETTIYVKFFTLFLFILYILFIYFLYKKITLIIEFTFKKIPNKLEKFNIIKFITAVGVGVGVGLVGLVGLGLVAIEGLVREELGISIGVIGVAVGVLVVVKRVIVVRNIFFKIFLVYLILFTLSMIFTSIVKSSQIALIATFFYLPSLFLIKKIGFGLNLIFFGILLLGLLIIDSSINQQDIYIVGLFLIILPLSNSLLDYISLKISTYMARQIMLDSSVLIVLLHLLADFIIAIILLLVLAFFLHISVEILNLFIDKPIPMKTMIVATWHEPFSIKNRWITFMLLSTLMPTVLHLVVALGAFFITIMPSEQSLKELKMYNKGQEALLENAAHYFTRIFFIQTFFSFLILFLLSLPFWYHKFW